MSSKKTLKFQKQQITSSPLDNDVFNFAHFKKNLQISIINSNSQSMQMQLKGIDASIINALRRIIIAEIPTMAFHKVLLYQNTSVLPDQLLVHRIGLLPLSVDVKGYESRKDDQQCTSKNSLKFELKVTCKRKKQYQNLSQQQLEVKGLKPQQYLQNANIYSSQIRLVDQTMDYKLKNSAILHPNILIAKLRQNQQIFLEIYAEKGIGRKHAKWSPVSTCFYRLMPEISLSQVFNHQKNAQMLVDCCPVNVFQVKKQKAIVKNPKQCTTCRQCVVLQGVQLKKIKDHFIFTIQSIGFYKPQQIFMMALDILEEKAKAFVI